MSSQVTAHRRRGRLIIKYYAVGEHTAIACPECSFSRDVSATESTSDEGPSEVSCPYCSLPLAVITSPLEPIRVVSETF